MKNILGQLAQNLEEKVVDSVVEAGEKVTNGAQTYCWGIFVYEDEYPTELLNK